MSQKSVHPWSTAIEELDLPSGLTAKVKPVRMQALIRAKAFDAEIIAAFNGENDDVSTNLRLMAEVAARALVEPKVTFDSKKVNESKGVFHIDSMPDEDLSAVFAWANGSDVETFRDDSASDGASESGEVLAGDA